MPERNPRSSSVGGRLRAYAERDGRGYPDWAMRYLPVLRRLGHRDWPALRILEIGANENGFARFSGARVMAIDIEREQLLAARAAQDVSPLQGDIGALPFPDACFDLVVCMDTYEHIPAAQRPAANCEIVRVLRPGGTAAIGFPSGDAASAAEGRIRSAYRALTGGSIRWLDEHVAMGLPDADAVRADLAEAAGGGYDVTQTGNASLWAWEWMWRVLMCNWPGRGNAVFQVLLRWSVPVLSRLHFGACYRTILWVMPAEKNEEE